ncbi:G-alpha-domain-containing protein [Hyaloscypha hepaticicola]|uniref:G-alpha-domain-containing protein n=1 Tax=Hyaloscypha hepaticicola TaxID=2082293 RepID=A0A2J6Q943_9HELO|nr:G-alpha-domain-containing protein [Hyaloscypha hepaticicola]
MSKECNVLLLGDRDCRRTFIKSMQIAHSGGFTSEERRNYREVVVSNIVCVMEAAKRHAKILSQEIEKIQAGDRKITIDGAAAVQGLWEDKELVRRFLTETGGLADSYFVEEILRIARPDYLPTDADILKLRSVAPRKAGIQEFTFEMGSLSLHIFDISCQRSERRKWIHHFENTISIVYCVDISQYDERVVEDSNEATLTEGLMLFGSVINSRWFSRVSIILLLCNIGHFKEKLRSKPLVNYFPDYSGRSDFGKASKYRLWWFNQVNRSHLNLYPHLCEPSDVSNMRLVLSAVKETVLHNATRAFI